MRKDLLVVGLMLLIVVGAVVYGIEKTHNKTTKENIYVNTSAISGTTSTSNPVKQATSTQTQNVQNSSKPNATKTALPQIHNTTLLMYSFQLMNITSHVPNSTAEQAGDMYYIQISGLFNYPSGFVQTGNYTLIMMAMEFTLLNGTQETVYIPIYQKVVIANQSTMRFVVQIEGNGTFAAQLYHDIAYMRSLGIYNVKTMFYLLPPTTTNFYDVIGGVASI